MLKALLWAFVDGLTNNDEKVASSSQTYQIQDNSVKPYSLHDQNG